jgi:hypothetical protein
MHCYVNETTHPEVIRQNVVATGSGSAFMEIVCPWAMSFPKTRDELISSLIGSDRRLACN